MNSTLVVALFQNASLLLALVVVFDFIAARGSLLATRPRQFVAGLAVGVIGVMMIGAAVRLESGVIFDTRSVLLAVAGLFLGGLPTAIAVVITSAFRLLLGGPSALTGVAVIVASGAIGVAWHTWRRSEKLEDVSWRELYAMGIVVHAAMLLLMFTLPGHAALKVLRQIAVPVMLVHPLATVAIGMLFVQRLRFQKAAETVSASESRFRLLAENARDVIFRFDLLPEPRFTYVSPSAVEFTGYTPEDYYADPDFGRKLVHPEDRPLLEAARTGETSSGEPVVLRWIRKNGEILWTEQRNTYIRNEAGEIIAVEGIVRDVTGSKQADVMIRTALKATNQGLYDYDLATGKVTVSEEYARMLGYEPAEFRETFEIWMERIHPDDADRVSAAVRDYLEGRTNDYHLEFRLRTKNGQWRWVLALASIVSRDVGGKPLRLVGTHTDITAIKASEQVIRNAQEETARLLANAEQSRRALLSLVEDQQAAERQLLNAQRELRRLTQILEASQAAARVGGWELDVATNTLFWTDEMYRIHDATPEYTPSVESAARFFAPPSAAQFRKLLEDAVERGVTRSIELELVSATGRKKWVQLTSGVTLDQGRPVRVTGAMQDISARKEAERERLELTAQLHQAQKLESLGSLAGGIAHDMNNVLAAILSSAEAHRRRLPDDDPLARSLDTIANACVRGRSVVRSLLYFARTGIETRGAVDLNEIVREIADLLDKTTLKKIRFTIELQRDLPTIDADQGALSHAVMNLCVNSVDAMPNGGALTLRTRTREDGFVEVSVRDTGTGMSAEVRERAVEPFFTTKPVGKGTGLGLAMVYGTVRAHHGMLEINSVAGEGTEVRLAFPPSPTVAPAVAETGGEAETAVRSARLTIQLIDDDELIRAGVSALLQTFGHEVHTAAGGAEALAQLEAGLDPDLVVLDVNMPGLSGPETLGRLLARRPDQVVLMASGFGDEEMTRAMSGRPNVLAIQKPFTIDELEAKFEALGLG